MARAPFQVLVLPYLIGPDGLRFAIFKRSDAEYWQFIAGGGEDSETPLKAAKREAYEEAGISIDSSYTILHSTEILRVENVAGPLWGSTVAEIPEHCFAVELDSNHITLSNEHTAFQWCDFDEAINLLYWNSNQMALKELGEQIAQPRG
jgi:dATP pyrophosphohydrolase